MDAADGLASFERLYVSVVAHAGCRSKFRCGSGEIGMRGCDEKSTTVLASVDDKAWRGGEDAVLYGTIIIGSVQRKEREKSGIQQ